VVGWTGENREGIVEKRRRAERVCVREEEELTRAHVEESEQSPGKVVRETGALVEDARV
jgi:hypothetical protein